MRRLIVIPALCIVFMHWHTSAKANNAAAGEIVYAHLNDSTYRVIFRLYTDCKGDAAPATVMLCAGDTCGNNSFSTIIPRYAGLIRNNTLPNGSETPIACTPKQPTRCTDPNSTLPGYREWWYVDTITLPSRCTGWRLSVTINSRNSSNNLDNGNLYVETFFNNQISLNNSSPDFANQPLLFVCLNQPFTYNIGATDTNGDSLDIAVVPVKVAPVLACPVTPYQLGLIATNPPFNWNNNPFQTNNSFSLDQRTGEMKFTATSTSSGSIRVNTFTLRINEYRNGQLIGSVSRDMQVYVFSCGVVSPGGSSGFPNYEIKRYIVPGGEYNGRIWAKTGQPIHLAYTATSDDEDASIVLADNHDTTFSNATFYYIGNKSNNVEGHFFWTPGKNDTGNFNLVMLITDSACRPPGTFPVFMQTTDIAVALSIDEETGSNGLKIYPNPNNGLFALSLAEQNRNAYWRISVSNVYGQEVHTHDNYIAGERMDLTTLPAGTYLVRANSGDSSYWGLVSVK